MRILICDPMPKEFKDALLTSFEVDEVQSPPPDELKRIVSQYEALVVRSATKVTAEVIEAGGRLRVIARAGAGLENIDVEAAARRGVKVINVPEAVANAVAELTIGLALSLIRSIPYAVESLRARRWEKRKLIGRELEGMSVGVVGLGAVGSLVARKLVALGSRVVVYRRNRELLIEEAKRIGAIPAESLEELLRSCELVTLHIPYTREAHHLLSGERMRMMPRGSYLVNTSRAWVVDGRALLEALNEGHLEGAAVDVHYNEPPREEWEWELILHPRVVATPHIGAQTVEAGRRISELLAAKLAEELLYSKA